MGCVRVARQGNDWGPQYQAAFFPHDGMQQSLAEDAIAWGQDQLRRALRKKHQKSLGMAGTDDTVRGQGAGVSAGLGGRPWEGARDSSEDGGHPERGDSTGVVVKPAAESVGEGSEGAASADWWEGEEIRTLVIPAPTDVFEADLAES